MITTTTPAPQPRAAGTLSEIHTLIDRLGREVDLSTEPTGLVTELERAGRRLTALRLQVVASSSTEQAAADGGFASSGDWLARQTRTRRADAAREVRLAEGLAAHTPTREALAAGDLSADHAKVITDALDRLPSGVTPADRGRIETDLVAKAARFDPHQLRRIARRALESVEADPTVVDAHEDTLVAAEEDAAHAKARLTFHDNDDGTLTGHFTVPTLAGDILRKVIDAMTAPRRQGHGSGPGLPDVDWAARRGAAFIELLEHLPTDHLHSKTAATVVVQLRHDVLLGALAVAGTDTDQPLSASAARRLACTAGIIPTVLGGASLPLDLGREQRLFTEAQRVALATRHTTCAADGCQRPYAWCELHHAKPWSRGGRTDLDQAVPLCAFHHRRIHDHDYTHHDSRDGITFTRLGARSGRPPRPPIQPGPRSPKADAARSPQPAARPRITAPMRT